MSLVDGFGRPITYLRLSVTDRCDFRCVYCMAEEMQFLPRDQILSIEEMTLVARAFTELGVNRIRITGGEPLVRRNIGQLFKNLQALPHLNEVTLTTNGSQLAQYASLLFDAGVRRINISLDSLQPDKFSALTRTGNLSSVLAGIDAARDAGIKIKLNSVVLKNRNGDEVLDLVAFAIDKKLDISFIEEMPLGVITEHRRQQEYMSSAEVRVIIQQQFMLTPSTLTTAGPSRYWNTSSPDTSVGFISPHSENFCDTCNRVRVTAEGKLLLCLGNEQSVDLRKTIRQSSSPIDALKDNIIRAMHKKPEKHDFTLDHEPKIIRFMNMTGG